MKFALFHSILGIFFHVFVDAMYNGDYQAVKDYPYVVQLNYEFYGDSNLLCSAAILSDYWVIAAAHCAACDRGSKTQVRVGSSATVQNGTLFDIEKYFVHGDYYPEFAWDNDIALIKLKTPIKFNEYQQPIQVAKVSPEIGDNITVVGFGFHHHFLYGYSLRAAQTSIIEDNDCFESFESKYTKNMICTSTKNIDLCYGDSGGPAVQNGKLIGINSQGCEVTKPNILTKVANYYDWILQTTGIQYAD